jgi:hypothetical protein
MTITTPIYNLVFKYLLEDLTENPESERRFKHKKLPTFNP